MVKTNIPKIKKVKSFGNQIKDIKTKLNGIRITPKLNLEILNNSIDLKKYFLIIAPTKRIVPKIITSIFEINNGEKDKIKPIKICGIFLKTSFSISIFFFNKKENITIIKIKKITIKIFSKLI
jgi:hypothetical protein